MFDLSNLSSLTSSIDISSAHTAVTSEVGIHYYRLGRSPDVK